MKRKPMNLKIGDKVTNTQLKKNGLVGDKPLYKGNRTWTVVDVQKSTTTISGINGRGKQKKPTTRKITRIILESGRGDKKVKTRTFWFD